MGSDQHVAVCMHTDDAAGRKTPGMMYSLLEMGAQSQHSCGRPCAPIHVGPPVPPFMWAPLCAPIFSSGF